MDITGKPELLAKELQRVEHCLAAFAPGFNAERERVERRLSALPPWFGVKAIAFGKSGARLSADTSVRRLLDNPRMHGCPVWVSVRD